MTFEAGSQLATIGKGAFADCPIKTITLPENLKTIESEAFRNCAALTQVNLSTAAKNISPQAFKYCYNLTAINVDRNNTTYSSIDGVLLTKNKETLVLFPPGKANDNFTLLPPSITAIGEYAFYDCSKLTNVTIPNLVTKIGARAFGLCKNLNTITFLCDEMIDPANINTATNYMAFDDGTQADDMFGNITIHVRADKLADYQSTPFYCKFKGGKDGIKTSFVDEESDGEEEYIAVSDKAVDLLSTSTTDNTYILPKTVSSGGKEYKVSLIGDYAFQNVGSGVKEVVIFDNVEYIGAKAFMTDIAHNASTVENIFFIESEPTKQMLSTTRFELDDTKNDYSEIAPTTKVYVKKSAIGAYKTAFARYLEDAYDYNRTKKVRTATPEMFSYKIPGITIANRYGSFAREFDVDLYDYTASGDATHGVRAYTTSKDNILREGKGDGGETDSEYYIQMHSINEGASGDGTYIPAGTGVLLRSWGDTQTPDGYYYTIGEEDRNAKDASSLMIGSVVNPVTVTDTDRDIYIMAASGVFKPLGGKTVTMPMHKAYLKLPGVPSGAKLSFTVPSGDEVSGVERLEYDPTDGSWSCGGQTVGDQVFDLQGRRVLRPVSGVYVTGGRKLVIR